MATKSIKVVCEIEELREAGGDGGDLMGYFCRDHVERWKFAEAANRYSGADPTFDRRFVRAERVRHVWWRTVPIADEPGAYAFHPAEPKARGAFPATVCECVSESEYRSTNRALENAARRESYGFTEGVNWALRSLERSHPKAAEALLASFRAKRPKEADEGVLTSFDGRS